MVRARRCAALGAASVAVLLAGCAAASVAVLLAGCGASHSRAPAPAARLEKPPGSPTAQIVLSALGARRIGLRTAPVVRAAGPAAGRATVVVPVSAIVYDISGQTYAFEQVAPLRYEEVAVTVDHVRDTAAYLVRGPAPGTPIVSIGAEELYGVQTGVLAQT